jgi:hypothetical protein
MITENCSKCGKVIEAYTQRHLDTLMAQHKIKHINEAKKLVEIKNDR